VLRAPELDAGLQVKSEQRNRIPSLTLLAMLLGMQPRMLLVFWAVSAHCWVMLSFPVCTHPYTYATKRA